MVWLHWNNRNICGNPCHQNFRKTALKIIIKCPPSIGLIILTKSYSRCTRKDKMFCSLSFCLTIVIQLRCLKLICRRTLFLFESTRTFVPGPSFTLTARESELFSHSSAKESRYYEYKNALHD